MLQMSQTLKMLSFPIFNLGIYLTQKSFDSEDLKIKNI